MKKYKSKSPYLHRTHGLVSAGRAISVLVMAFAVIGVFFLSAHMVEDQAYQIPKYAKADLETAFANGQLLTEDDFNFLYQQTGLGRQVITSLMNDLSRKNEISGVQTAAMPELWKKNSESAIDGLTGLGFDSASLQAATAGLYKKTDTAYRWSQEAESQLQQVQRQLFSPAETTCVRDSWVVQREQTVDETGKIVGRNHLDYLQNGDILVTNASHIGGWRNGHAAIVVDAEKGKTLEAITIFEDSALRNISKWEKYPNVLVLRLKDADQVQREAVAQWAKENMLGKPYQITAGILGSQGTQCAHLVWKAYKEAGYDLNTGGSLVITPKMLANSSLLEVVQVCGMDPDQLWK